MSTTGSIRRRPTAEATYRKNDHMSNEVTSTRKAFEELGVTETTLSPDQKQFFDENGYLVIPMEEARLQELGIDLQEQRDLVQKWLDLEGPYGGREGKEDTVTADKPLEPKARRLANMVDKEAAFRRLITIPEVLAATHHILKDDIKLSSLNMREPMPGQNQRKHIEWAPRSADDDPYAGILTFLFIDDSNLDNGPLKVIPGSHRKFGWPDDYFDPFEEHPDEVILTAPAGTLVAMNVHLWHGGTKNLSGKRRRTQCINYRRRSLPQLLNQKRYLSPATLQQLSPAERYLLAANDDDPIQEDMGVGVAAMYQKAYGRPIEKPETSGAGER